MGGEGVQIRRAEVSDLAALTRLWKEFIDFNAAFDSRFTRARGGHRHWAEATRAALDDPDRLVLVARVGRRTVGFVTAAVLEHPPMVKERTHGFLKELAVTQSARRKGVGAALYAEAERWIRARGAPAVELHVASSNPVSMAFWRSVGYETFLVRMAKTLRDPRDQGGRKKRGPR